MVLPPPLHCDTAPPISRSGNASGYNFSGFGSANGIISPFAPNNGAFQSAVQFADQQSPFGGSRGSGIEMIGQFTHSNGVSQSAVQPVVHQQSPFGGTSLQPKATSFLYGDTPTASGFGTSNPTFGSAINPIAPTSRAPAFGSAIANPIPFGASTSANGFSASNPTFGCAVNLIASTSSAPALGSTSANPNPFGAPTSSAHVSGSTTAKPTLFSAPIFGATAANSIPFFGVPTSSTHVFGSNTANPTTFGSSTFGVTTANSIPLSAITANSIPFGAPMFGSNTASPSVFGGSGQSFSYSQQFGSLLRPYTRTIDSDRQAIISISAMDIYKNKSHEELRLEDYMLRINVSSLFPASPVATNSLDWLNSLTGPTFTNRSNLVGHDQSNTRQSAILLPGQDFQCSSFSSFPFFQVPFRPSSNTGPSSSNPAPPFENASQSTGTSSSMPVTGTNSFVNYYTQPQPSAFHNFPVAIVTFIPPEVASYIASYVPLLGNQISPTTTPFGRPTTSVTSPSVSMFGGSTAMTGSVGAPSTSFVGLNVPNFSSTAPTSSTPCNFSGHAWLGSSGGQSTVSASVSSPTIANSSSQSLFHFPAPSPSSGTQEACKNTASWTPFGNMCSNEHDTSIPKGLEIIAEKLGFNPWSSEKGNANKLDSEVGSLLPCVDADKDEDIIALAEFAVEQHNTLHKDDVIFAKVVVACLEAVGGGRYHIVLETMPGRRSYAVVLRKGTQRSNHVTVLEKWISSKP